MKFGQFTQQTYHSCWLNLGLFALGTLTLLCSHNSARAQTFLFDFGANGTPTAHADPPGDPVFYWNNVPDSVGSSNLGQVTNIVTSANLASRVGLVMVRRFNGANENGTTLSTLYPENATRDSLYGNTEIFNNLTNIFPSFKLVGLEQSGTYTFTFYASRTGVTDVRETEYTIEGASTEVVLFDPANNVDATVTSSGIRPTASGEITISLAPSANNNNGFHFTYLGVLKVDASVPQTPIGFTLQPTSQRVVVFQPVSFVAAVTGAPPYAVQWYQNGGPIPDATGLIYNIPSVGADLDGATFSVSVSNLVYGVHSTNAVLRVSSDTNAPVLLSASSASGFNAQLAFNEALEPNIAVDPANYVVNGQPVAAAALVTGGSNVFVTFAQQVTGAFTIAVSSVQDLAGNTIAQGTSTNGVVPALQPESWLFDFGGGNTTETSFWPDDAASFWNNVSSSVATSDFGELPNLVTSRNRETTAGLVMLARFNGVNENGVNEVNSASPVAPFVPDATRDSLFGNTEVFSTLENIFPSFKLTGLDPEKSYQITFYASRMSVGDNRQTAYTVVGVNSNYTTLNAANNITNLATVTGVTPTAVGEVTISLAPGPLNNNGNHFTYLGVMRLMEASVAMQFLPPVLIDNQIRLEWTGGGQLEGAPALSGPWTTITPTSASAHTENIVSGQNKFFRLRQ